MALGFTVKVLRDIIFILTLLEIVLVLSFFYRIQKYCEV